MLQHTFQIVGGIGPARERELWRDGIESWRDLPQRKLLARRPDWNHPIPVAVVQVCGNTGYNWFDLPT